MLDMAVDFNDCTVGTAVGAGDGCTADMAVGAGDARPVDPAVGAGDGGTAGAAVGAGDVWLVGAVDSEPKSASAMVTGSAVRTVKRANRT